MNRTLHRAAAPAALLLLALTACGGGNEVAARGDASAAAGGSEDGAAEGASGEVLADGSSTVQPLTAAAGELFRETMPDVNVSVGTSGTGGGFEVFCQGATDIANASRAIKDEEAQLCADAGIEFTELTVATDALTVVVSAENDFITCLTTEELATLWGPDAEGAVTTWDQVDAELPAEPIELYGPGTDSGTFDYFTAEINGEEGASRTDYNASEDDNTLVQGVSGSPNALGYFGYTYYEENAEALKAVEVDSGDGCVAPSAETAADGTYAPLARPLFIYVNDASFAEKTHVAEFIRFYAENDAEIAEAAAFIPLSDEAAGELVDAVEALG
ncbi:MAG: phosphate binding protein [Actinotalea sp.]|nr:phosphate binding protein [Actinotalea sp.]